MKSARSKIALFFLILSWALCLSAFEALGTTGTAPTQAAAPKR